MPSNTPSPVPHWHAGVHPRTTTRGVIHLIAEPIELALNARTKCGRYLTLVSLDFKEPGDRPCMRCHRG